MSTDAPPTPTRISAGRIVQAELELDVAVHLLGQRAVVVAALAELPGEEEDAALDEHEHHAGDEEHRVDQVGRSVRRLRALRVQRVERRLLRAGRHGQQQRARRARRARSVPPGRGAVGRVNPVPPWSWWCACAVPAGCARAGRCRTASGVVHPGWFTVRRAARPLSGSSTLRSPWLAATTPGRRRRRGPRRRAAPATTLADSFGRVAIRMPTSRTERAAAGGGDDRAELRGGEEHAGHGERPCRRR